MNKKSDALLIRKAAPILPFLMASTVPGLALVAKGFLTGDAAALAAGVSQASLGFVQMGCKALEKEDRKPTMEKSGMEIPLRLAAKLATSEEVMRAKWFELLKNSLDADYPHKIRQEDVDLAASLSPSDLLLMYCIGKHKDELSGSTHGIDVFIEGKFRNIAYGSELRSIAATGFMDLKLAPNQASIILGSTAKVPLDELLYSLLFRGDAPGGRGDLFKLRAVQDESGENVQVSLDPFAWTSANIRTIHISNFGNYITKESLAFSATLTRPADRLWRLFDKFGTVPKSSGT